MKEIQSAAEKKEKQVWQTPRMEVLDISETMTVGKGFGNMFGAGNFGSSKCWSVNRTERFLFIQKITKIF